MTNQDNILQPINHKHNKFNQDNILQSTNHKHYKSNQDNIIQSIRLDLINRRFKADF